jgi:hypothetical protein
VLLIAAIFLVGCASYGAYKQCVPFPDQAKPLDDPAKGRVYVLNESYHLIAGITARDRGVGYVQGPGYLCWEATPGRMRLTAERLSNSAAGSLGPVGIIAMLLDKSPKSNHVDLVVEAGKTHFVRVAWKAALSTSNPVPELIRDEKEGWRALKGRKPPPVTVLADPGTETW